jgi:hypothetical protein
MAGFASDISVKHFTMSTSLRSELSSHYSISSSGKRKGFNSALTCWISLAFYFISLFLSRSWIALSHHKWTDQASVVEHFWFGSEGRKEEEEESRVFKPPCQWTLPLLQLREWCFQSSDGEQLLFHNVGSTGETLLFRNIRKDWCNHNLTNCRVKKMDSIPSPLVEKGRSCRGFPSQFDDVLWWVPSSPYWVYSLEVIKTAPVFVVLKEGDLKHISLSKASLF